MQKPRDLESVVDLMFRKNVAAVGEITQTTGLEFLDALRLWLNKSGQHTLAEGYDTSAIIDGLLAELRKQSVDIVTTFFYEHSGDLARALTDAENEIARKKKENTEKAIEATKHRNKMRDALLKSIHPAIITAWKTAPELNADDFATVYWDDHADDLVARASSIRHELGLKPLSDEELRKSVKRIVEYYITREAPRPAHYK